MSITNIGNSKVYSDLFFPPEIANLHQKAETKIENIAEILRRRASNANEAGSIKNEMLKYRATLCNQFYMSEDWLSLSMAFLYYPALVQFAKESKLKFDGNFRNFVIDNSPHSLVVNIVKLNAVEVFDFLIFKLNMLPLLRQTKYRVTLREGLKISENKQMSLTAYLLQKQSNEIFKMLHARLKLKPELFISKIILANNIDILEHVTKDFDFQIYISHLDSHEELLGVLQSAAILDAADTLRYVLSREDISLLQGDMESIFIRSLTYSSLNVIPMLIEQNHVHLDGNQLKQIFTNNHYTNADRVVLIEFFRKQGNFLNKDQFEAAADEFLRSLPTNELSAITN